MLRHWKHGSCPRKTAHKGAHLPQLLHQERVSRSLLQLGLGLGAVGENADVALGCLATARGNFVSQDSGRAGAAASKRYPAGSLRHAQHVNFSCYSHTARTATPCPCICLAAGPLAPPRPQRPAREHRGMHSVVCVACMSPASDCHLGSPSKPGCNPARQPAPPAHLLPHGIR